MNSYTEMFRVRYKSSIRKIYKQWICENKLASLTASDIFLTDGCLVREFRASRCLMENF